MAKKFNNFSVGDQITKENPSYTSWTNDILRKLIASKTVINAGQSTGGHRLIESEVVFVFLSGFGEVEIIEYSNHEAGHGSNPSFGIEHKEDIEVVSGDILLAEEGDFIKIKNTHSQEQLTYLRIFDKEGWRIEDGKPPKT
tara:strand:- start:4323 stop:4745 length:423 start_codon:yes stop_codon:yes gene_type:complete